MLLVFGQKGWASKWASKVLEGAGICIEARKNI
jgi:hypothetical protein